MEPFHRLYKMGVGYVDKIVLSDNIVTRTEMNIKTKIDVF